MATLIFFLFCILLSMILLTGTALSEPKECTLKVFDTDSDVPIEGICISEFRTEDCKPFVQSFNRSDLPKDFALTDEDYSVGKPESITLRSTYNSKLFLDSYQGGEGSMINDLVPGVVVDWNSPTDASSRRNIKGYLLIGTQFGDNTTIGCRLFKFNTTNQDVLKKKLRLQYSTNLVSQSFYEIRVYSMPPPETLKDSQNKGIFEAMEIISGSYIENYENPANWTPSLSVKDLQNGSLRVSIGHSPRFFGFTKFEVKLKKYSYDENYSYKTAMYTQPRGTRSSEGVLLFKDLETDMYKVKVRPIDTYPNEEGKCLCYTTVDTDQYCEPTCMSVETKYFNVTGIVVETTTQGNARRRNQETPSEVTKAPVIDSTEETIHTPATRATTEAEIKAVTTMPSTHSPGDIVLIVGLICASAVTVSLIVLTVILLKNVGSHMFKRLYSPVCKDNDSNSDNDKTSNCDDKRTRCGTTETADLSIFTVGDDLSDGDSCTTVAINPLN